MPAAPEFDLLPQLEEAGLVSPGEIPALTPLRGGVSSEIVLVTPASGRKFVVKRALGKLKVKDDWFADPVRNRAEQAWFDYVAGFAPAAVPKILHRAPDWFAMEHLQAGLSLWKEDLLAGRVDAAAARSAGEILGLVHRRSWGDPAAKATFATGRSFYELRIAPYLVTSGQRLPRWQRYFDAEAERLAATGLALVHGDYSPKNLLTGEGRFVILDAEVAWFGDPAFDLAFLLTHLHLKALWQATRPGGAGGGILALVPAFWTSYRRALGANADAGLEARTAWLLHLLLLARVHGKSPVEYLDGAQQSWVTRRVGEWLAQPADTVAGFTLAWKKAIASP